MTERAKEAAREILLAINPPAPNLIANGIDSWSTPEPLATFVKEFGWDGAEESPYVRQILSSTVAILRKHLSAALADLSQQPGDAGEE